MTTSQTSVPWITLIAALGIGSIIAAVVGWWSAKAVAISNHRQNWINALRDDLATFLKEIDDLHYIHAKIFGPNVTSEDTQKLHDARNSAMLAYRRIHMRLNITETSSIELSKRLSELMTITSAVADSTRIEAVVNASRQVLQQEWAVTKFGLFTGPIMALKESNLRKGFSRIGILLVIIWVAGVIGLLAYEYENKNPFCQFDESITSEPVCEHILWAWKPTQNSQVLLARDRATESKQVFTPQVGRIVGLLLGIPLLGWILTIGVLWIIKGFRNQANQ